jgi:hypothetical protein
LPKQLQISFFSLSFVSLTIETRTELSAKKRRLRIAVEVLAWVKNKAPHRKHQFKIKTTSGTACIDADANAGYVDVSQK